MVGDGVALQLLAMQRYGEAGRALQFVAMARPTERCSSLLWRGRQRVAARCCGNGQQCCNSRRWAGSVVTHGDGRQCVIALANAALQRFCFFLLDNFKSERERDRKRKGGRAFETCSKISTLLVGMNVTRKLPPVPMQAPSGSNNTNTLWLQQQ
jgi:hypothetical protein